MSSSAASSPDPRPSSNTSFDAYLAKEAGRDSTSSPGKAQNVNAKNIKAKNATPPVNKNAPNNTSPAHPESISVENTSVTEDETGPAPSGLAVTVPGTETLPPKSPPAAKSVPVGSPVMIENPEALFEPLPGQSDPIADPEVTTSGTGQRKTAQSPSNPSSDRSPGIPVSNPPAQALDELALSQGNPQHPGIIPETTSVAATDGAPDHVSSISSPGTAEGGLVARTGEMLQTASPRNSERPAAARAEPAGSRRLPADTQTTEPPGGAAIPAQAPAQTNTTLALQTTPSGHDLSGAVNTATTATGQPGPAPADSSQIASFSGTAARIQPLAGHSDRQQNRQGGQSPGERLRESITENRAGKTAPGTEKPNRAGSTPADPQTPAGRQPPPPPGQDFRAMMSGQNMGLTMVVKPHDSLLAQAPGETVLAGAQLTTGQGTGTGIFGAQAGFTSPNGVQNGLMASETALRPATTTPSAHMADQIVSTLTRHNANGRSTFRIQLHPAELGQVDVRMDFAADGKLHTVMTVDNDRTLMLLQRDQGILEKMLQNAGFDTSQGSLNFSLKHQNQTAQGDMFEQQGGTSGETPPTGEAGGAIWQEPDSPAVTEHLLMSASAGGIDISI